MGCIVYPLWRLCIISTLYLFLNACGVPKGDLFNNIPDSTQALHKHKGAWVSRYGTRSISRLQMFGLMKDDGSGCVTEEDNWKRVDLDKDLRTQHPQNTLIACYADVRGRFPFGSLKSWRWTVLLKRHTPESFIVLEFRRTQISPIAPYETAVLRS